MPVLKQVELSDKLRKLHLFTLTLPFKSGKNTIYSISQYHNIQDM